jgi:hypothetical protein
MLSFQVDALADPRPLCRIPSLFPNFHQIEAPNPGVVGAFTEGGFVIRASSSGFRPLDL